MTVRLQSAPFNPGELLDGFGAGDNVGAVVSFTGKVRADDALTRMEIEHYPGMTGKALEQIEADARARWPLSDVLILHRYGPMRPGENIMMVATASRHRVAAFEAAEFLMDFLKSRAPFWKKEFGPDGAAWVAAKDADEDALTRW
ncbi:MAG: molybdenum cofactor biosynthesis protein MoaE [Rhodobacterales bacterium]|nr:MAG: molybdenum cofactor biosynthesis protein MoaE [Rhodobacterales bacterium]